MSSFTFTDTIRRHIDPISARYTAIANPDIVPVTVIGARDAPVTEDKEKHAKYSLGTKKVVFSKSIILEQADAASFTQDEEITLMNWGNAIVRKITHSINPLHLDRITGLELELHLQGDVKKTKKKVTWLSKDQELVPVELVEYDHLVTKDKLGPDDELKDILNPKTEERVEALADCNVADLKEDDVMQFDRKG